MPELRPVSVPPQERSKLLERFCELSSDGHCILDGEGRLVLADASFRRLSGLGESGAEGRSFLGLVLPEDRPAAAGTLEAAWRGPGSREHECRLLRGDGTALWVGIRAKAEDGRLLLLVRDVHARREAELELAEARRRLERREVENPSELRRTMAALEESEALFRAISEELPDALLLLDQESEPLGRIVHANPAACEQQGYTLEELTDRTVFDLDDEPTAEANQERLGRIQSGETVTFEGSHQRKDGSVFPVEVVAREIYYRGRRLVLAIERDLSERREQEAKNRRLQARALQSQKLETLGVLAGGIAHDFNNLLVGILGNAGLALEDLPAASEVRPFLEEIEDASERAAELCRQMLAYSGKGQFVLSDLRLDSLVREMAPLLWASISRKAELDLDLRSVPSVRADAEQMRQLVLNLVSNASDALGDDPGNVRISLRTRLVSESQRLEGVLDETLPAGTYAELEVSDTGSGMDETTRQRLFDPFFTTKFTGRGMGLAAVLGIVRGHKGTVQVESEPRSGSSFSVLLPVREEAGLPFAMGFGAPSAEDPAGERRPDSVMVVDDEPAVRSVAARTLERAGFHVYSARGGREALEIFERRGDRIICVVLDLSMPEPDGRATLEELRRLRPNLPVVMSSGHAADRAVALFEHERPTAFLEKPYRPQHLLGLVREVTKPTAPGSWDPAPTGSST